MTRWLARALEKMANPELVPKLPKWPKLQAEADSGTHGHFGTASEGDLDERAALAEAEGGVSALYSLAFAKLQMTPPPGLSVERWLLSVDDAGRFLDSHGALAERLGWSADALFAPAGLIRSLRGAAVVSLSRTGAHLSDGRVIQRAP
jgi:hypothetical protein